MKLAILIMWITLDVVLLGMLARSILGDVFEAVDCRLALDVSSHRPDFNVFSVAGKVAGEPIVYPSGQVEFSLALNDRDVIGVVASQKGVAEILRDGVSTIVTGKINIDRWQDDNGKPQTKTRVIANRVNCLA